MSVEEAIAEIKNLDVEARLEAISQLWDSIAEKNEIPISDEHKQILDSREKNSDPTKRMTLDDFKKKLTDAKQDSSRT